MNAFEREPEQLAREELLAVEQVIRSAHWILGKEVASFEQEWARYTGSATCVGVASGMDALQVGLMALGIGPGDEVITTPMTAYATVLAIIRAGATPVLADIESDTAMLSAESVSRCLSDSTRAVVLVHLYGKAGPSREIRQVCEEHGIALVEDCAQAHGAMLDDQAVGQEGAVAAWSFYPTKNLGAVGDAGAVCFRERDLADKARVLRNYGQSRRYHHDVNGLNSRLDEVQAAILRKRLVYLDTWIAARRATASRYLSAIVHEEIAPLAHMDDVSRHGFHLFVVRTQRRDELIEYLASAGIDSLIHYPVPVHFQPPAGQLGRDPAGLENAERHAQECLSIPCHPYMLGDEVEEVIDALNAFG